MIIVTRNRILENNSLFYAVCLLFIMHLFTCNLQASNAVFDGTMKMIIAGVSRSMVVHVPADIENNRPLMISLHGRWGTGAQQQQFAKFETIADTARFIVVYPDGLPQPILDGNTGWDAGGSTDNDITFFKAIIDTMYVRYKIDRSRVYLSGFSLGGMETYHAVNVAAETFAAFASVSGYPLNEYHRYYTSARPVPFMHIHGKADSFVKVDSMQIVVDNWVARNGCNPVPEITDKSGVYTKYNYAAENNGFEYIYYALDGRGHEYTITSDFNPSKEIWNFVKRYTLYDTCDTTMKWNPNLQMQAVNTIPAGWGTVTGNSVNKGLKNVTSGSRIISFKNGSDFARGFYIKSGYILYGFDEQRPLQLEAGRYTIKFSTIACNSASIDKTITLQLINRKTNVVVYSTTVQPTSTVQDSVAKGFIQCSFDFTTNEYTEYTLKWKVSDTSAEMAISNVGIYSSEDNTTKVSSNELKKTDTVNVYSLAGIKVRSNVRPSVATEGLEQGIYILNNENYNKKIAIK